MENFIFFYSALWMDSPQENRRIRGNILWRYQNRLLNSRLFSGHHRTTPLIHLKLRFFNKMFQKNCSTKISNKKKNWQYPIFLTFSCSFSTFVKTIFIQVEFIFTYFYFFVKKARKECSLTPRVPKKPPTSCCKRVI